MPQKRKIYSNLFITYFASQLVLKNCYTNYPQQKVDLYLFWTMYR